MNRFSSTLIGCRTVCFALLIALGSTASLLAAPVDKFGATVDYLGVLESVLANTSGGTPTFNPGTAIVAGDTIVFSPTDFSSLSTGGGAPDITDVQLNMTLMSHPGHKITDIEFNESGDFSLFGSGSALTQVAYALSLATVRVLEVDGLAITPVSGSALTSGGNNLLTDPGFGLWDLSATFDVEQLLLDNSIIGGATKVEVVLDNQLIAISQADSSAFVAKKSFEGVSIEAGTSSTIPEPSTATLLGLSVLGFCFGRRRRA